MFDEFDNYIKEQMQKTAKSLPNTYEEKIARTMEHLSEEKENVQWKSFPRVAAIVCVCVVLGTTGVYAGVKSYMQRLESISDEKIREIDSNIQEYDNDADAYTRELTESEKERMEQLRQAYENEGKFPEGEMTTVEKVAEVKADTFCYCYENSTVYLPKEELTDEQLLQLIDLQHVRDYAVSKKQGDDREKIKGKGAIGTGKASRIAVNCVEYIYGDKLGEYKVEVDNRAYKEEQEDKSACYIVKMRGKDVKIDVDVNAYTGEVTFVYWDDAESVVTGIPVKEDDYIAYGSEVQRVAEYIMGKDQLKKINLSYLYEQKTNNLYSGSVGYYAIDNVGKGYVLAYSVNLGRIDHIFRMGDYEEFVEYLNENEKENHNKNGRNRKFLELELP